MAQINLLKQNKPSALGGVGLVSVISKLAIVGLLALAAYYGWVAFRQRDVKRGIEEIGLQIERQKQELSQVSERDEILTRQSQIKEFDSLISAHMYWSQLLPELAKVTLKNASYLSFRAQNEGTMTLEVKVPSIAELDKFLLAFDSPKLNRYFSDLKIGGINKVFDGDESYVSVSVQLKYDPKLLEYKAIKP